MLSTGSGSEIVRWDDTGYIVNFHTNELGLNTQGVCRIRVPLWLPRDDLATQP